MSTKNVRKSPMISSAQINGHARLQAAELFKHAKRKTGSKMLAYERVATAIGVSPGWFRKYVKGYEAKEPKASVYENIRAHYSAFCERIEQENEQDELRLHALRRDSSARNKSFGPEGQD